MRGHTARSDALTIRVPGLPTQPESQTAGIVHKMRAALSAAVACVVAVTGRLPAAASHWSAATGALAGDTHLPSRGADLLFDQAQALGLSERLHEWHGSRGGKGDSSSSDTNASNGAAGQTFAANEQQQPIRRAAALPVSEGAAGSLPPQEQGEQQQQPAVSWEDTSGYAGSEFAAAYPAGEAPGDSDVLDSDSLREDLAEFIAALTPHSCGQCDPERDPCYSEAVPFPTCKGSDEASCVDEASCKWSWPHAEYDFATASSLYSKRLQSTVEVASPMLHQHVSAALQGAGLFKARDEQTAMQRYRACWELVKHLDVGLAEQLLVDGTTTLDVAALFWLSI